MKNKICLLTLLGLLIMLSGCKSNNDNISANLDINTTASNNEIDIFDKTDDSITNGLPIEADNNEKMPNPFSNDGGDKNMQFYSTVDFKLGYIDMNFVNLVDSAEFEQWLDSTSSSCSNLTSVEEAANLYSFIKYFDIKDETVRETLVNLRNGSEDDFTDAEINLILSNNAEAVAKYFVSDNAICKGENLYSLFWIYNHSINDYIKNGISANEIESKMSEFDKFPLTSEAKEALESKMNLYIEEYDNFVVRREVKS